MPTVTNPSLTLTTVNNSSTKLTVAYDVEFGKVDRNLVSLGVEWHPHIDIIGYDGPSESRSSSTTRSTTTPFRSPSATANRCCAS